MKIFSPIEPETIKKNMSACTMNVLQLHLSWLLTWMLIRGVFIRMSGYCAALLFWCYKTILFNTRANIWH